MAKQEKGGFRPPPLVKILWKCGECNTFNAADAEVVDESLVGATKPIDDSERHLRED